MFNGFDIEIVFKSWYSQISATRKYDDVRPAWAVLLGKNPAYLLLAIKLLLKKS